MILKVVLDANVLIPAALRDTLLRAAVRELYRPCWSDEILEEVERVLIREGMASQTQARRLIDTLRDRFSESLVPMNSRRLCQR